MEWNKKDNQQSADIIEHEGSYGQIVEDRKKMVLLMYRARSYDYDSGKEYVIEKYLFSYIFGFSALVAGGGVLLLISLFAPGITVNDSLENIALIAVVCVLLPSIEIPASIIFGAEKGKLGYYILVGIIMAIYGIGKYIANFVMMSNVRESLATKVMAMPKGALAGIGIVC